MRNLILLLAILKCGLLEALSAPYPFNSAEFPSHYGPMSAEEVEIARDEAKRMFYFGYDNYMEHAFPKDELDPIHCRGRGHDHAHPDNININDVLGDYSLTLVDSLNTLAILGNRSEFHKAVRLVMENVSFEKNVTVQVFESTIRVVGSLLSTHLILTNDNDRLGDFRMNDYNGELLTMAHDLVNRLMPAFSGTKTGIPYPRVNLQRGVLPNTINETCTAGAGSLLLEFGILSRLINDDVFEKVARRVNAKLWERRHSTSGLLGNVINVQTGEWVGIQSGLGAGLDSFFEYLLKSFIMFGEQNDLDLYVRAANSIRESMRRGRPKCRDGYGDLPLYVNVDMRDSSIVNTWADALQASFAGVQVLAGDLDEAICLHAFYYAVWSKYEMLPERYNWHINAPDVHFYPLRPEFIESTYLLWLATKSPFYQHVGREIMDSLNTNTRVTCGFATVHNVLDKSLEDRMESFFLSETCKYLYLLFDEENPVNRNYDRLLFSTEGHLFPILDKFRTPPEDIYGSELNIKPSAFARNESCETPRSSDRFTSPLNDFYILQYMSAVGVFDADV